MMDTLLATVFALIFLVAICLQLFLMILPVFSRIEFDAICHSYALRMDQEGGMTVDLETAFRQALSEHGFDTVLIQAPRTGHYGQAMLLTVQVNQPGRRLKALKMEAVVWTYTYQASLVCRVIAAETDPPGWRLWQWPVACCSCYPWV